MAATLVVYHTEYELWHSDWLKLFSDWLPQSLLFNQHLYANNTGSLQSSGVHMDTCLTQAGGRHWCQCLASDKHPCLFILQFPWKLEVTMLKISKAMTNWMTIVRPLHSSLAERKMCNWIVLRSSNGKTISPSQTVLVNKMFHCLSHMTSLPVLDMPREIHFWYRQYPHRFLRSPVTSHFLSRVHT